MFYKMKIVKSGLRYLGLSLTKKDEKDIVYLTEQEMARIAPEVITNPKAMKEI